MTKTILLLTLLLSFTSVEAGSVQCQGVTLAGEYCRNMVANANTYKGPFCRHHDGNNLNKLRYYLTEEYKEAGEARKLRKLEYNKKTPLEKVFTKESFGFIYTASVWILGFFTFNMVIICFIAVQLSNLNIDHPYMKYLPKLHLALIILEVSLFLFSLNKV